MGVKYTRKNKRTFLEGKSYNVSRETLQDEQEKYEKFLKIHKNIKNVSRETLSVEIQIERCYNYSIMVRGLRKRDMVKQSLTLWAKIQPCTIKTAIRGNHKWEELLQLLIKRAA